MSDITYTQSDSAIAETIGQRLKAARLERDQTQEHLAAALGVSIPTYIAAESGKMKLGLLIAALRHLDLLDNLNTLLPEEAPSPILQVKLQGKTRQRASKQRPLTQRMRLMRYPKGSDKSPLIANRVEPIQERFAHYTLVDADSSTINNASKDEQEW